MWANRSICSYSDFNFAYVAEFQYKTGYAYFDVIEEWRQRYDKGHLEIRKNENKRHQYIWYGWSLYLKKTQLLNP
jgi:hypothetical protein